MKRRWMLVALLGGIAACHGGSTTDDDAESSGGTGDATGSTGGSSTGGTAQTSSTSSGATTGGNASTGGSTTGGSTAGGSTERDAQAGATGGDASEGSSTGDGAQTGATSGGTTGSTNGGSTERDAQAGATDGGATSGDASDGGDAPSAGGALIQNDQFWKDSSGDFIYSQGGGVLRVDDTFYWYGVQYNGAVSYAAKPTSLNSDTSFAGVTIYSSKDLAHWTHENTVKFSNAGSWFGRLGVVHNANTGKYVLVAQGAGGLFFATSDTPAGDFAFDHVETTLSGIANGSTGDQTMFQDDDGKAYLICSSSMGRSNLYVVPLRASDFLALETPKRIFGGAGREGNAMFKYDGNYYFCSSDLHGWNASHTYCISASNILGPYGDEFVLANTDADFSHVSQTGFFVTVTGTAGSFVIFAGDRWSDFAGNGLGYNQWVPISFDHGTPEFQSLSEWSIDVATGTWRAGPNNNYAINPSFEADRVAVTTPAGWTATSGANVTGGHTGRWGWQLSGNATLEQQVQKLPEGTFRLSVWVKGSGASGAELYVDGLSDDAPTAAISAGTGWSQVTIDEVHVTTGAGKIGVRTSSGMLSVDDFVLVKTAPN